MLKAALVGLLAMFCPNLAVTSYVFPTPVMAQFVALGYDSYQSGHEVYVCFLGTNSGGFAVADSIFIPKQRAFESKFPPDAPASYYVIPDDCPPGTIADGHTHPPEWANAGFLSLVDKLTSSKKPYDLFLLAFPGRNTKGEVVISVVGWQRTSTGYQPLWLYPDQL